jgi:hypothetical protein
MKLIIDIPDREYKQRIEFPLCYTSTIDKAIANGTPLEFGNISVEAIEESSHCPACIHYVQRDVPSVFCNNCKNRDELYRRIKNEQRRADTGI